jgi:hypothetical protein
MIHVNFTPSTIFLTREIIAFTKYHLFRVHPFTYVSANQWGTIRTNYNVVKSIVYQLREGVCNLFAQRCQISFIFCRHVPIVIVAILIVS